MIPLGHKTVTAKPEPLYTATAPCVLELWSVSRHLEGRIPSTVYIQWTEEMTNFSKGTPLEEATKYEIPMSTGDVLWVVTPDLAQVGIAAAVVDDGAGESLPAAQPVKDRTRPPVEVRVDDAHLQISLGTPAEPRYSGSRSF